jgi:hypothetical protein
MLKSNFQVASASVLAAVVLSVPARADEPLPTVVLPPAYESIVASAGALATSGAAALNSYRSDTRTAAIRTALTKALLGLGAETTITLGKPDADALIGETALLCTVRGSYTGSVADLNYLTSLVQKLNAVSKPAPAPTDIIGALKLLFATANYSISDDVQVKSPATSQAKAATICETDLKSYDIDYYGAAAGGLPAPQPAAATVTPPTPASAPGVSFAFLGPIGSLIDTFVAILQPVLIDASTIVDQARRRAVVEQALKDPKIHPKIAHSGKQLALAVDGFAVSSRRRLAGSFVEQLVALRATPIDLSKEPECKNLAGSTRLPSGAPSAAFVTCWKAAWSHLQDATSKLATTADSYDTLADAGDVNAQKLFGTILADYDLISTGQADASNVFWNDVTQFITFANAISTAASKTNIATLQKELAAVSK